MSGQHIQKLLKATHASDHKKLLDSQEAWFLGYDALRLLADSLNKTAAEVERGFSDGVTADEQGTARRGRAAFETLRNDVVVPRRDQMKAAAAVLLTAAQKLNAAEKASREMPDAPADLPPRPSSYGTEDDVEAIRADRAYDRTVSQHNAAVSAYGDADERARKKLEALDQAYAEASTVLAKIHGEPVYPEDLPPPGEPGPGGFPSGPTGRPRPVDVGPTPVHVTPPHPIPPTPIEGPGLTPGPHPGPGPGPGPGVPPGGPVDNPGPGLPPTGPGGPAGPIGPGGGPGFNPAIGGGIAAGVFGGPGLVNAVKGAFGGRGAFGSSPGTIGSTSRTGGAGTLGRSGGGVPGSQAGRSGGRGAGGGRSGAAGTAGGRGRGGGRAGAAGAGAGGRGRKGREEEAGNRDLFDDGSDWIDDEGAGPDVLG